MEFKKQGNVPIFLINVKRRTEKFIDFIMGSITPAGWRFREVQCVFWWDNCTKLPPGLALQFRQYSLALSNMSALVALT